MFRGVGGGEGSECFLLAIPGFLKRLEKDKRKQRSKYVKGRKVRVFIAVKESYKNWAWKRARQWKGRKK